MSKKMNMWPTYNDRSIGAVVMRELCHARGLHAAGSWAECPGCAPPSTAAGPSRPCALPTCGQQVVAPRRYCSRMCVNRMRSLRGHRRYRGNHTTTFGMPYDARRRTEGRDG